ncbi:glycosyltransferase family 2 protein [Pseudodesulfovibrio sp. zrk46]|uniref:glycosyltransferase family 2 protein n=1 Tax=Pseudodesulfovibrio sp. zrk46 TaxID=2725288 RepID=UPI001448C3F4|nr:glycosyltransferase family 2 protein [Pseudodesulfovibrio sp. zrk46]QJB58046.1 glycosyltransferase family 2 protein [Pseudodesulfovibrio sp. zrk46]
MQSVKISIVIPVYNSEKTIRPLVDRLVNILPAPLEIVLVNDGSKDASDEVCRKAQVAHPSVVTYVELSKNYGEHCAVMAGLNQSTGDYVVIMDDDFQNPPEEALKLVDAAQKGGHDVVYSYYNEKKHHFFRNLGSKFNGAVATLLLKKPKDLYLSSFKCINRFLVNEIIKYDGPYPYVDGLIFRITDKYGVVEVQHDARHTGESNYTLTKLVRLWMNMFFNFSLLPLRVATMLGAGLSGFALLYMVWISICKLFRPELPPGWSETVVLIALFSGAQLIMLGLLGEYVGRIFLSQNKTPQFCIRKVHKE